MMTEAQKHFLELMLKLGKITPEAYDKALGKEVSDDTES